MKKKISIVTGCYNEEENIEEFYRRVISVLEDRPEYDYEIIVADNYSRDKSREILRSIADRDKKFKVIFNSRNFGPICSGYNAFMQAEGDAVILMSLDLQDPPEILSDFVRRWEEGYEVVVAVKKSSKENALMKIVRKAYYRILSQASEGDYIIKDFTGFGLYGRKFMNALKLYRDPIPYFRGFVSQIGFKRVEIEFEQPRRKHGKTKHNLLSLYDVAITGFVNHSRFPLKIAMFSGFMLAAVSFLVALGYLVYKIACWNTFTLGLAPLVIGMFFFSAVQLIFIGIIGEYIGAVLTQVKNRPLVIEEEKINFQEREERKE
ncbi:MAG: glycosyltransferase family 2 protein [Deltaproteobacteria bacterium]|nr:glycosyltransferase family 2 protein [Deltaproteobacteria bacterium]